jgi:hypothetical protein
MIIDPPSVFSPSSEWTRFRKDMEALLADDPGNDDVREWLATAKKNEAPAKS